jgi:Trk K+ transport system NAD-binding subunit
MFDRIVLVGAGRTSGSIVERLARIAPVTIIDVSPAALDIVSTRSPDAPEGAHPIVKRTGDGTSRLVLEDLRGDPRSSVGLVVAPGDDRAALESCRLGAELAFQPIVVIVNDRDVAKECEKHGAQALVRAEIVGQLVEQSLQQAGLGFTSALGSGRGEILEFSVLPSSPAIGVPLSRLRAEGWRVAAIYRGEELVLPTGSTVIAPEDRVLIVGDPKQLPHIAESLRVGLPTFPLLHGPNVVVYLPGGLDGTIESEGELLTKRTRASRLVRAYPGATVARKVIDTPLPDGSTTRRQFEDASLEGNLLQGHIATLRAKQPGVVVTRPLARTPIDVVLGHGGREAILCNEIGVPVLFPRGSAHHERVVLCVTDGESDLGVAEVALDLARMFDIPLVVLRVKLPTYLQSAEAATDKLVETIAQRARLHGLQPEVQVLEGNPIAEWVRASVPSDLAVISRRESLRDSFSRPDLALRVARKSRGSVLVVTVKD